jgi:CRP-like cAMP-binding protein
MESQASLIQHLENKLGLLPDAFREFCKSARCQTLDMGSPLLRENARSSNVWWIESGCLRLYYVDSKGREWSKNFYSEGSLIWPITSLLSEQPVSFWVDALETTKVWLLPWRDWHEHAQILPTWARFERNTLAYLLEEKMKREFEFLHFSATARYQRLLRAHPDWSERIALRHLASYLGITDVALSRIRRELSSKQML